MNWLVARVYDGIMRPTEEACLRRWRSELLAGAVGEVLEIGAGTGANLGHYPEGLGLTLAEPDPHMRRQLQLRVAGRGAGVAISEGSALALPFEDGRFDAVVSTLVLCSVPDLERSLAEIYRVLAPGGALLFLEHVVSEDPGRRAWQHRIEPLWRRVAGNCHLTRDTAAAIAAAGFELEAVERESMRKAAVFLRASVRGVARKPGGAR